MGFWSAIFGKPGPTHCELCSGALKKDPDKVTIAGEGSLIVCTNCFQRVNRSMSRQATTGKMNEDDTHLAAKIIFTIRKRDGRPILPEEDES